MENMSISECVGRKLSSKKLQIRLMGHCIICLRKISTRRKVTSELLEGVGGCAPEIAPKSVVTCPGFLLTFNQVWALLQTKWKHKNIRAKAKGNDESSEETGISLENILRSGSGSTNVIFSRAPTICQLCCDKVLAIENLMKAVRQQVREISMLLEEGRRRQEDDGTGGRGEFEKSLQDNGLEESVIRATLEFVGVFGTSQFPECTSQGGGVGSSEEGIANVPNLIEMQTELDDEQNSLESNYDHNEGQTGKSLDEDDGGEDPDYIKSEPEEDDDDESEEEMEVDDEEEDTNDPDFEVEKDSLALFRDRQQNVMTPRGGSGEKEEEVETQEEDQSGKFPCSCGITFSYLDDRRNHIRRNRETHPEYNWENELGSGSGDKKDITGVFPCSCGKTFDKISKRSRHMRNNKELHPEFKVYSKIHGNRQSCDLCGERIMYNEILGHLTGCHLNGQVEWVIRCPNEKCRSIFVSSKGLQTHLSHNDDKECRRSWKYKRGHICETCGFKGTSLLKIKNHVRDKHENEHKGLRCPISDCGKMFCVKQSVHFHLDEHRYRPPISEQICDKCGESLKLEEMEVHLKDKHGIEEVVGCKQCEMKFSGRYEMIEHLYEHRREGILCDICGDNQERFVSRYSDFREHYYMVHQLYPKKYKCGECDKWYWRMADKEEHELRIHRKESAKSVRYREKNKISVKNYECEICNVKFLRDAHLTSHNIKIHGADPYKCDICGETFDEQVKFNKHVKEHKGIVFQKEWKCEVEGCGKLFKARKGWRWHLKSGHGAVKPHVCELCGKGYTGAAGLRHHHDVVHLGKREWVCDECGERFGGSTTLKTHKLIHTGERPFGCDICGQRFRHKEVLRRHVEGHEKKGAGFKPNGPMKQIRKRKAQ